MVSEMAMEDVEQLEREGVRLTPREIIRLNAYGVRAQKNSDLAELSQLPRACVLNGIGFSEPTIGADIWLHEVSRVMDMDDFQTFAVVKAVQLSRKWSELPNPLDVESVQKACEEMKERLRGTTFRQLFAVLEYIQNGNSAEAFEAGPKNGDDEDEDGDSACPRDDVDYFVGVVSEGLILEIGSISDIKGMTTSQLQTLIAYKNAMKYGPNKAREARYLGDYYQVLEEIKKAHTEK